MKVALLMAVVGLGMSGIVTAAGESIESRAGKLVEYYEKEMRPLFVERETAWWNANVTGSDADYAKKEAITNKYNEKMSDSKIFKELKEVRTKLSPKASLVLRRQIERFYLEAVEKQTPADLLKKIVAKANAIEKIFNVTRAKVGGKELADSDVKKILKESKDSKERQAAWEASKVVGANVEKDLKELVALRNQQAKSLGYSNFHSMSLELSEEKPSEVLALFDSLDKLTRDRFLALKKDIDTKLAAAYKVTPAQLRPWHYHDPFFQDAPSVYETDLDATYANQDIVKLTRDFYAGLGLPVDGVLANSSLFEQPGKSPHAFCTDINRNGDVRVLANVVPTEGWMSTMLHEVGHAVYASTYIPPTLPFLVRDVSHILTTEGIAMLFQKFSKSADWLKSMGVAVADPVAFNAAGKKLQTAELLVFSRWAQVMFRFEKSLYENPKQDLNKLWWDLVERYQGLKRPENRNAPDYAAKIHVVSAPAYYHNYMMGQLFASQVHHAAVRDVLKTNDFRNASYVGNKAIGDWYKKKIFDPGATLTWNELTKFATGQSLNPKAFVEDL